MQVRCSEKPFGTRAFSYLPTGGIHLHMVRTWSSEASIQTVTKLVMGTILDMLGLQGLVLVEQELTIFALRPDLSVVLHSGVAIGVVEVKPPLPSGAEVLQDPRMAATMADYLRCLKAFSGLPIAFGLATTYTDWRCFWLAEDKADALAREMPPINDALPAGLQAAAETKDFEESQEDEPNEATAMNPAPPDHVHASRVYSSTEKVETVHFIASAVMKMIASTKCRVHLDPFRRDTYLCFHEEKWSWLTVQWSNKKLTHSKEPKAEWFAMLGELGHGSSGTVWHACTAAGIGCAIKFQRRIVDEAEAEERLQQECDRWNQHNIYKPFKAKVVKLAGKSALLMPYMHKIPAADLQDESVQRVSLAMHMLHELTFSSFAGAAPDTAQQRRDRVGVQ